MNDNRPTPHTPTALSQRETAVLAALARFRFLTVRHVEAFLFLGDESVKESSRLVITRRTLKRLREQGLITRTERAIGGARGGSGSFAYYLTRSGGQTLHTITRSAVRRTAPRGTFLMRHALATADVALSFLREAEEHREHEMLVWESDWEIAQRIGEDTIIPDAFLVYADTTTELHAFLEVDLGTAGSRFFQSKVERYLRLYRSGLWQRTLELWPTVLTVTPTETRSALLKRSTETVLRAEPGHDQLVLDMEFAFTELDLLIERGPLAQIWQIAGRDGSYQLLPDHEERKEVPHG